MMPASYEYKNSLSPARQLLPLAYIEHMPVKRVGEAEYASLRCDMDFNPPHEYGLENERGNATAQLLPEEVGQDQLYRYVLVEAAGESKK